MSPYFRGGGRLGFLVRGPTGTRASKGSSRYGFRPHRKPLRQPNELRERMVFDGFVMAPGKRNEPRLLSDWVDRVGLVDSILMSKLHRPRGFATIRQRWVIAIPTSTCDGCSPWWLTVSASCCRAEVDRSPRSCGERRTGRQWRSHQGSDHIGVNSQKHCGTT